MSLILAIEPDRRQAAQLTGAIRHRVGAELVLADTTERALDAIGNRVPDLVLVPALLSPQDDAALAAALRVIATAAHVRTLTTPVLASTSKRTIRGGVLAKWRRSRANSPTPDGCDPAVFAEQMRAYLKEVAAERAELEAAWNLSPDAEESTQDMAQPVATEPVEVEPPIETPAVEAELAIGAPAGDDTSIAIASVPIEQPPALKVAAEVSASPEDIIDLSDLSQQPVDLFNKSALKELFGDGSGETDVIASASEEPAIEVFDLLPAILEGPEVHEAVVAAPELPKIELWTPVSLGASRPWPQLEGMQAEAAPVALKPDEAPVIAQPQAPPVEELPDRSPWVELIESLRLDIERLRAERLQPAPVAVSATPDEVRVPPPAQVVAATPPPPSFGAARGEMAVRKPKRRMKKPKPIQDEWGFFDPEQCGFAALLAKLDEITDGRDEPEARPPA